MAAKSTNFTAKCVKYQPVRRPTYWKYRVFHSFAPSTDLESETFKNKSAKCKFFMNMFKFSEKKGKKANFLKKNVKKTKKNSELLYQYQKPTFPNASAPKTNKS
jgi:hypothetical protein